jgi:hypothetical protein
MNRRQFIATTAAALGATHVKAFLPAPTHPAEIEIYYESDRLGERGWIVCPPDKVKHYIRFIHEYASNYHIVSIKPVKKPRHLLKWSYVNV